MEDRPSHRLHDAGAPVFIDTRRHAPRHEGRYDLCIVGAGAAGIPLANRFIGKGLRVCVLESGGIGFDARTQTLYGGAWTGSFAKGDPRYLSTSRTRFFGGTTNDWAGRCSPLTEADFAARDWVPESGWPIDAAELAPYYPLAAQHLDVYPVEHHRDNGYSLDRFPSLIRGEDRLRTALEHVGPPTSLGRKFRSRIERAENVDVYLHGSVVDLALAADERTVSTITARTLTGETRTFTARAFVLATGGIENARLLLHFNRRFRDALGNRGDQVGRYFMDHARVTGAGHVWRTLAAHYLPMYHRLAIDPRLEHGTRAGLYLDAEASELYRVPSFVAYSAPAEDMEAEYHRQYSTIRRLSDVVDHSIRAAHERREAAEPRLDAVDVIIEPLPDPNNRVQLMPVEDEVGVPRAALHFSLPEGLPQTVRRCVSALAQELGRTAWGRGRASLTGDVSAWLDEGHLTRSMGHHIGTTRMSSAPADGVVDGDCRVHGTANLYVAGSSVFPTAGFVGPTLTLTALALRLGDHLDGVLAS